MHDGSRLLRGAVEAAVNEANQAEVGSAAQEVVNNVPGSPTKAAVLAGDVLLDHYSGTARRLQFRERPGIMDGSQKPDYNSRGPRKNPIGARKAARRS